MKTQGKWLATSRGCSNIYNGCYCCMVLAIYPAFAATAAWPLVIVPGVLHDWLRRDCLLLRGTVLQTWTGSSSYRHIKLRRRDQLPRQCSCSRVWAQVCIQDHLGTELVSIPWLEWRRFFLLLKFKANTISIDDTEVIIVTWWQGEALQGHTNSKNCQLNNIHKLKMICK